MESIIARKDASTEPCSEQQQSTSDTYTLFSGLKEELDNLYHKF
jgi:hypothetical protein